MSNNSYQLCNVDYAPLVIKLKKKRELLVPDPPSLSRSHAFALLHTIPIYRQAPSQPLSLGFLSEV
jgi:hypothetical protein